MSLAIDNVVYIRRDGKDLEPNEDETLWFSVENPTGKYNFEVKTKAGKVYIATLDWTQPEPDPDPEPEPDPEPDPGEGEGEGVARMMSASAPEKSTTAKTTKKKSAKSRKKKEE